MEYLRSHEYTKAKIQFLELENVSPDYRATRRYLSRIDESLKKANLEAVTNYEKKESEHLKQLQHKEDTAEILRLQKEQADQQRLEEQQQGSLKLFPRRLQILMMRSSSYPSSRIMKL